MTASGRCGCLDEHGRQLGARCPVPQTCHRRQARLWAYRFSAGKTVDPSTGRLKRRQLGEGGFSGGRGRPARVAGMAGHRGRGRSRHGCTPGPCSPSRMASR
jgi:hypothetical protein